MRLGNALRAGLLACAAFATGALCLASPASAQIGSGRYSAIIVDHRSGEVLVAANPDETRHPASLTKMMTLYMAFEALRDGRLALDQRITFSDEAAARPPSKLGIPAGQSITVEQAILALVTRSANDAAAAMGERLGGSEARFAQMMTMRARALGMTRTTFRNASGLPDPEQVTTARDMALLGQRLLRDFPDRYHYFRITQAQFGNMRIRNHNRMLETYEGVDGIKTGFVNASGFNIVTSAQRGGVRLVGAVFGGSSGYERDQHMAGLLDRGFDQMGVGGRAVAQGPSVMRTAQAAALPRQAAARSVAAAQPVRTSAAPRQAQRSAQAQRQPVAANRRAASAAPATRGTAATTRGTATTTRSAAQAATTRSAGQAATTRSAAQAEMRGTAATTRSTTQAATTRSAAAAPRPSQPQAMPAPASRGAGTIRTTELR